MPTIGGENAITLMKNNSKTRHISIILFSANVEIEIIAKRANANGSLKKTFDVLALVEIVENIITETRS